MLYQLGQPPSMWSGSYGPLVAEPPGSPAGAGGLMDMLGAVPWWGWAALVGAGVWFLGGRR